MKNKIPNLFIVGAHKCGTTSLYHWLKQHPEIFMSEPKEPRFFCDDFAQEAEKYSDKKVFINSWKEYMDMFKNLAEEKIVGESSPHYLSSKTAPKNIYNHNPKAKIIICIREPIDYLKSFHAHAFKAKNENIQDFQKALEAEPKRKVNPSLTPRACSYPTFLLYKQNTQFSKFIKKYKKLFPENQIKIIALDEIKENPQKIYKEILEFLEVKDVNFLPDLEIKNKGAEVKNKFLFFLWKKYKNIIKFITPFIPQKIKKFLINKAKIKNSSKKIDPELKRELKEYFQNEVKELEKITNKNLSSWWNY